MTTSPRTGSTPSISKKAKKATTTLVLDDFLVTASLADNHVCGGYDGQFSTHVEISVNDLNSEGFVVDNQGIMGLIRDRFGGSMLKASCEELCHGVINVVCGELGDRLVSAKVIVRNLTGHVNSVWRRGMQVPEFPRDATDHEVRQTEQGRNGEDCVQRRSC